MTHKKVLLVDDDDLVRKLVAQYLEHGGYAAITAASGKEGIAKYETEQPDLVVMDIAMPEMSGLEAADLIREIQGKHGWPRTPIVLMTAYARSFFVPMGDDRRVDSFMRKPVTRDEFLQHIERFFAAPSNTAKTS